MTQPLDFNKTNIMVWCHPRSGSHNLMARLRTSLRAQCDIEPGNLYEMFPDHPALVGKNCHSEYILKEVAAGLDSFTSGLHWEINERGIIQTQPQNDWCYLNEIEHRLDLLESRQIKAPTIGKHITWWNLYTDKLKGDHPSFVDRVHSAVAGIGARNIVLYRQDLAALAASMGVLSLSYKEAGKRRGRIKTHGDVLIKSEDPAIGVDSDKLDRYIQRLMMGLEYLEHNNTVMITMEELDQIETLTWPDGYYIQLDTAGKDNFRSRYFKEGQDGAVKPVADALGVVEDAAKINAWAEDSETRYGWSTMRERFGFSRGF